MYFVTLTTLAPNFLMIVYHHVGLQLMRSSGRGGEGNSCLIQVMSRVRRMLARFPVLLMNVKVILSFSAVRGAASCKYCTGKQVITLCRSVCVRATALSRCVELSVNVYGVSGLVKEICF